MIYFATILRWNAAVTRDATTYSIMQLELLKFEGYLSALFEPTELCNLCGCTDRQLKEDKAFGGV